MSILEGLGEAVELAVLDRAIDGEALPWVPQAEGVWFKPLRFDLRSGRWINLIRMEGKGTVNRHRHTGGQVLGYCLEGAWRYLERDWVARPGTLVFEPPGDVHTLVVDEPDGMVTLFILEGTVQYLDARGADVSRRRVQQACPLSRVLRRAWHPRTGPRVLSVLDDLDGRVALVTGAARGIGQALALGLAEAGADIAVLDLLELDDTTGRIETAGRRCFALRRDLAGTTPESAGEIVAACSRALGRLDILVNNAGIIRGADAIDMDEDDWESVLSVDVSSAFYLSQAAARAFIAVGRPGKIVNVASVLSFQGGVSVANYAAAKSGLAGLTRALANEWAPRKINVNALAPGYFATEVTAEIRSDSVRSQVMLDRIPAGRWGEPADLMGAVVWLCSDASNYVNGSIVSVDGGWLAR